MTCCVRSCSSASLRDERTMTTSAMTTTPDSGQPSAMTRRIEFNVPARLEEVRPIAESLRAFMADGVPQEAQDAIELGIVEAMTNVVAHGYTGMHPAALELRFEQSSNAAIAELLDTGKPIPRENLERDSSVPFEFDPDNVAALPEHGMGLALIRLSFDAVQYQSVDGVNRLTMAKRFETDKLGEEVDP